MIILNERKKGAKTIWGLKNFLFAYTAVEHAFSDHVSLNALVFVLDHIFQFESFLLAPIETIFVIDSSLYIPYSFGSHHNLIADNI